MSKEAEVHVEQVRAALEQIPVATIVNLVNATIMVAVLAAAEWHPRDLLWLGAVAFVTAARLTVWKIYRRSAFSSQQYRRWSLASACGAFAAGLLWGVGSVGLPPTSEIYQLFWAFVIAGMCAGATALHYAHFPSTVAFLVPASLPLAIRFAVDGSGRRSAAAAMIAVFLVVLVVTVRRSSRYFGETLQLRLNLMQRTRELNSTVTALSDKTTRLEAANLCLDAALGNMSQGLCLYDANDRLRMVNRQFCDIFRLSPEQVVPGLSFREVLEQSVAAGNHLGRTAAGLLAEEAGIADPRPFCETRFQELSHGRVVAISRQTTADGGWVATYEDVTERQRTEAQAVFLARHDALTGLPNRLLFGERMEQDLARVGRDSPGLAVLILDLDGFKAVNDTLGHPVGDELLRAVADRLQACVREVDTVARLGGDEFAIVQVDLKRPQEAALLARQVVDQVSQPYDVDHQHITVGVSIGISLAPVDGRTRDELLKNADLALYRAKAEGRGIWRFFEPEMDQQLQARRALERDMREALSRGELELFYQPLFDLATDRIGGFEALLRWRHPEQGMVSPAQFVPVAEEVGLIVPFGQWVLECACLEASKWPAHIKVAVNVSPTQFRSGNLVRSVTDALGASGLPARRLELEITESVLLADSVTTLATLHALRVLGVRFSMDDFGTGYSSLSYLRSFPFDKIKIDPSFIRDLATTKGTEAIVRAIIGLGRSLAIRTTAEGVETDEQLAWLRAEGCSEAQGYLFSLPEPASEIARLLERWGGGVPGGETETRGPGAAST